MAKIGYARVSSTDQNLERQLVRLNEVGCKKIFSDKMSGGTLARPSLQEMMNYIREGDVVVVTELDRLGRNNEELTEILDAMRRKGVIFEALNLPSVLGIQDENLRRFMNNLVIELFKYVAESERKKIRERQRQGIALAKQRGVYKGRKFQFTEDSPRLQLAFQMYREGRSIREVVATTGIPATTFHRYRKLFDVRRS